MKKWLLKHKDIIITNSIAGVIVIVGGRFLKFLFNFLKNSQNGILNFLNKIIGFSIKIPVSAIVFFVVLIILIGKVYDKIKIKNRKLKIIKATYGSDDNFIDITRELNNRVTDNKLKTVLSNDIAGDPHRGIRKKGEIVYKFKGKKIKKDYIEGETIELP